MRPWPDTSGDEHNFRPDWIWDQEAGEWLPYSKERFDIAMVLWANVYVCNGGAKPSEAPR